MLHQQLSSLLQNGPFCPSSEAVDDGQYDVVSTGAGQPSHKIHRDVGLRTARNRQRLTKPLQGQAGTFVLVIVYTGLDVIPNVVIL